MTSEIYNHIVKISTTWQNAFETVNGETNGSEKLKLVKSSN